LGLEAFAFGESVVDVVDVDDAEYRVPIVLLIHLHGETKKQAGTAATETSAMTYTHGRRADVQTVLRTDYCMIHN
jgi:hypothetical protein